MDIVEVMIGRAIAISLGIWVGLSSVVLVALLWQSYQRYRRDARATWRWVTTECGLCNGNGMYWEPRSEQVEVCPLCDGDGTIGARKKVTKDDHSRDLPSG